MSGAPADCELREWPNSWQITAQAAEADLVLTECILFDEAWPEVVKTGECVCICTSSDVVCHGMPVLLHGSNYLIVTCSASEAGCKIVTVMR